MRHLLEIYEVMISLILFEVCTLIPNLNSYNGTNETSIFNFRYVTVPYTMLKKFKLYQETL